MKNNSKLILIAGGTASGKSMIADMFEKQLDINKKSTTIIRMDNYYKDIKDFKENDVSKINWDEPSVFDWKQLLIDIDLLMNGKKVERNIYFYKTGKYTNEKETLLPNKNLILEGLFTLHNDELRKKSSLQIYVDVDSEIRMERRINRDFQSRYENKFDREVFIKKWRNVIQPMHEKYVKETSKYADKIIYNNEDLNNDKKIEIIKQLLNNK